VAAGGEDPTRLYSRTGDRGETGLVGGARVGKDSQRVRTYGTYDELVSQLGVAAETLSSRPEELALLRRLSHETFLAMAELATPHPSPSAGPRIGPRHVARLETDTERLGESIGALRSFVIPGGTLGAAQVHVARAVARRAERELWALHREEPQRAELLQWANRLSSVLFALALAINHGAGIAETPPDYSV
jgi:cob(I)alamin adenosyltransferase